MEYLSDIRDFPCARNRIRFRVAAGRRASRESSAPALLHPGAVPRSVANLLIEKGLNFRNSSECSLKL